MYYPHRAKVITKSPELDRLGKSPTLAEHMRPCRIDEGTKIVTDRQGEEVVTSTQIIFPAFVTVAYHDQVEWTSSAGVKLTKHPTAVQQPRDTIGRPRMTVVDFT